MNWRLRRGFSCHKDTGPSSLHPRSSLAGLRTSHVDEPLNSIIGPQDTKTRRDPKETRVEQFVLPHNDTITKHSLSPEPPNPVTTYAHKADALPYRVFRNSVVLYLIGVLILKGFLLFGVKIRGTYFREP